jgi:hypothetical protein
VERRFFFGSLPVHLLGFRNEQTGSVLTREMRTDFIEPFAIEQGKMEGWRQIESAEALAVKPVLALGYTDYMPTLDEWHEGQNAK